MTKTLTEQWREGKLPKGLYYTRSSNGRKGFSIHTGSKRNMFSPYDKMAHQTEEVLSPVPSYDEYNKLVQKMHTLEDKLREAEHALNLIEVHTGSIGQGEEDMNESLIAIMNICRTYFGEE